MIRHFASFALALSLVGCSYSERPEDEGDSQSNLTRIEGEARLSLTVEIRKGSEGIPAHVTARCGPDSRDNRAGEADNEGIVFPLLRPENCAVVVTVKATAAEQADTVIELAHPGKANNETVVNAAKNGYAVKATFADPAP